MYLKNTYLLSFMISRCLGDTWLSTSWFICMVRREFETFQRWPEDALRKSAEIIFEEVNADRAAKKTVMQIGMDIFEQAMYDLF